MIYGKMLVEGRGGHTAKRSGYIDKLSWHSGKKVKEGVRCQVALLCAAKSLNFNRVTAKGDRLEQIFTRCV